MIIAWLKEFTPAGGGGSNQEGAYVTLMQGRCATSLSLARAGYSDSGGEPLAEPYRSLFEGAASACLAAFHQRADLWTTAISRFEAIEAPHFDCWDLAVYRMLRALVTAHREDPDAVFTRGTGTSDCPEITALVPDHGSRGGGYVVEITGRNLPASAVLQWDAEEATAERTSDGRLVLEAPAAGPDAIDSVHVGFVGGYRGTNSSTRFTYDD